MLQLYLLIAVWPVSEGSEPEVHPVPVPGALPQSAPHYDTPIQHMTHVLFTVIIQEMFGLVSITTERKITPKKSKTQRTVLVQIIFMGNTTCFRYTKEICINSINERLIKETFSDSNDIKKGGRVCTLKEITI